MPRNINRDSPYRPTTGPEQSGWSLVSVFGACQCSLVPAREALPVSGPRFPVESHALLHTPGSAHAFDGAAITGDNRRDLRRVGGTPVQIDSWSDGCSANEKETNPNRSVIHQESGSLVQEFQYSSVSGSTKQRFPLSLDHQVDPRGLPAHGVAGIGLTNPERARKLTGGKWKIIKPGTPVIPAH